MNALEFGNDFGIVG